LLLDFSKFSFAFCVADCRLRELKTGIFKPTPINADPNHCCSLFKNLNSSLFPVYPPFINPVRLGNALDFSSLSNNSFERCSFNAIL
jgi:hypothetical protein